MPPYLFAAWRTFCSGVRDERLSLARQEGADRGCQEICSPGAGAIGLFSNDPLYLSERSPADRAGVRRLICGALSGGRQVRAGCAK